MKSNTKAVMLVAAVVVAAVGSLSEWAQSQTSSKNLPPEKSPETVQTAVKLEPLNVKPGLWETTITRNMAGELPIPAEMLSRLTPEQRARMEDRMHANSAAHSASTTHKGCTTKEDLQRDRFNFGKECTPTILATTSTMAKGKISCETEGMSSTGSLEITVVDQEHLKGSSHATVTGNGHTMNVDSTFTSKWLSSSCGDLK